MTTSLRSLIYVLMLPAIYSASSAAAANSWEEAEAKVK